VGRLDASSAGRLFVMAVVHSATPMGAEYPRSAYSATTLSFDLHSSRPIVGLSSGWASRSSMAAMYMPNWPRKLGWESPALSSMTT